MQYYFVNFTKDELSKAQVDNARVLNDAHDEHAKDADINQVDAEWNKAA